MFGTKSIELILNGQPEQFDSSLSFTEGLLSQKDKSDLLPTLTDDDGASTTSSNYQPLTNNIFCSAMQQRMTVY